MGTRSKESRRRIHSLILLIAFTSILLIMSTYAWFTTQKDVTLSNIRGKVEVAESLEISLDAETWQHEIDLSEVSLTTDAYDGNKNWVPDELFPVSSSGEISGNALAMYRGKYNGFKLTDIKEVQGKEKDATTTISSADYPGYFAFDIFLRNLTKEDNKTTSDKILLNSNSYAWVLTDGVKIGVSETNAAENVGDAASGLQNSLRIGFARYGDGVTSTSNKTTILANDDAIDLVSIWEPNHNMHVENVVTDENIGKTGALETATTEKTIEGVKYYVDGTPFYTKTIKKGLTSITNVFDWTNEGLGQPVTNRTTPVETFINKKPYIKEGALQLKTIDSKDFVLVANTVTKVRVYIWMEGQDPDCTVLSSNGGGVEVQIGLAKGLTEKDTSKRVEEAGS